MITYQAESFTNLRSEFEPLFDLHWREVARNQEFMPLDPDWYLYESLENLELMYTVTARDEDKLIGYINVLLSPQLHYKSWVTAQEDIVYLLPEYRKGFIFQRMLRYAEGIAKSRGAVIFYAHMKSDHDYSVVLKRAGYTEIEKKFEKQLYSDSERQSWQHQQA